MRYNYLSSVKGNVEVGINLLVIGTTYCQSFSMTSAKLIATTTSTNLTRSGWFATKHSEVPFWYGKLLTPEVACNINKFPRCSTRNFTQRRGADGLSDVNSRAVFAGANINNISGCQLQIFNGPVKFIHESNKRRRFVIESEEQEDWLIDCGACVPLHVFSFTETPFEALLIEVWTLIFDIMSMNFSLPSCNTSIKTFL